INKKIIILIEHNSPNFNITNNKNPFTNISDDEVFNKILISHRELKLSEKYLIESEKGEILYLDDQAPIGQCALTYLNLKGSTITLALTPNRADLLSHIGFAKDLQSILESSITELNNYPKNHNNPRESDKLNPFSINIKSKNCYEYNIRYITNLTIKTSPLWLRNLLITNQIEPVNNVIDVINLIIIEYGIPLNVLDADQFNNQQIEIRNAKQNEKIINSKETYFLRDQQDIVITNNNDIISLADILNNSNYEITNKTKKIIITSSYWNIESISEISKHHQINNQKTLRLTKGIDQSLIETALEKATFLIQQLTDGIVHKNIMSQKIQKYHNPEIKITLNEINKKVGLKLSSKKIINNLKRLNYKIKFISKPQNYFIAQAPERRYDITTPEDIISDLVRLTGYNNKQINTLIDNFKERNSEQKYIIKLKKLLANLGFYEIKTYKLVNEKLFNLFYHDQNYLSVIKPITEERKILRQSLSGSMLEVLEFNQKNKNTDNAFFEISNVFYENKEVLHLSLGISGYLIKNHWLKKNIESSFFILKGILEKIANFLNINMSFCPTQKYFNLHPGAQSNIKINRKNIGFIGEMHPKLNNIYHLNKSFIAEINLDMILKKSLKQDIIIKKINKLPYITRDLSFWINKKIHFQQIFESLKQNFQKILIKCELLDIYTPDSNNKNKYQKYYSLSFRLTFENINNNLNKNKVEQIINQIENNLKIKFQAQIR
ncbi:MAG: phenylalanine--tRNA ligase subunit beta, partial [Candidatus Phytoplasma australasiaticum]|nr:phenylalanine--tRNA ligase subunit beta [Candidatus Phytoplasma australasiaticum]